MKIVLIGIMGAGKTTVGKSLSKRLSYEFYDMDKVIEEKAGMSVSDIFSIYGEDKFREMELAVAKELMGKDDVVISTGGGVVIQKGLMKVLKNGSKVIYIERNVSEIIKKVNTKTRPLLRDNPDKLYDIMNERRPLYEKYADYRVMNKGTISEISAKIVSLIKE